LAAKLKGFVRLYVGASSSTPRSQHGITVNAVASA
jgi:hypothetical protein